MRRGPPMGGIEALAVEVTSAADRGAVLRRLGRELTPHARTLGLAGLYVLVVGAAQALAPWIISIAIDRDLRARDPRALATTMSLLLVVYVAGALALRAQMMLVGATGQRVLHSLRSRLFARLVRLPLGYFDKRPIGDLLSRTLSDVDTLNGLLSQGVTQLAGAMLGLIGVLVAMLVLNPKLALASFTLIPAMLLTTQAFAARARAAFRKTRETTGAVTAEIQEEIVGVRQAQAFGRTEANLTRFKRLNEANRSANVAAVGVTSAFAPSIEVLSTLGTAIVIGYGGWLVYRGELTVGLLAAFLIYVQQFFRPLQLAAQVYATLQSALAGSERIYAILDEPEEPADAADALALAHAEGRIEFEGVSFEYAQGRKALDGVSFTALPGQSVALVGRTGAGKTTIASLLPRFYDPSAGRVLLDGHDLRALTRRSLRAQLAIVSQEPFLFSGTVAENIAYARPEATREQVEAAARAVDAHAFLAALPNGFDTLIGEGGASLSAGQRQLVSFARAILADARVLILDEATSSIDARTEALIQRALEKLLQGRTSVIIAHRLSTVRGAELILVVEDGRIVERGTHADLLAAGGVYAGLTARQLAG